jgi:hypothetical protein
MINWILDNLPLFVNVNCSGSKSLDALILSPVHGVAIAKMTSGAVYSVPVRRLDMLKVRQYDNAGEWLNAYSMV